ncbi:MAG: DNA adenine methylase [Myxococcota bacterium]|nr:DNA adenine methylase [Myxococcota bacterium]
MLWQSFSMMGSEAPIKSSADQPENEGPQPVHTATAPVYRPFHYLGSKLRVVDAITQYTREHFKPGSVVMDPFCGSTVVAQSMASIGMRVLASDALQFCASAARASLGVGRNMQAYDRILTVLDAPTQTWHMAPWINAEKAAIAGRDGAALMEISTALPQVWRGTWHRPSGEALVSSHYAGTYFGITQAVRIDAIRRHIDTLDGWARDVALTALTSAMSACAFSAGKHFAQAHRLSSHKDLRFHAKRALIDRAQDIDTLFRAAVESMMKSVARAHHGHAGRCVRVEDIGDGPPVDLIYADPPYTAQQYSRFYHVPEVVFQYQVPTLQVYRGRLTAGLYPAHRFKSAFCSKRKAENAFRQLAQLAQRRGAELLLSYSVGRPQTGNARVVSAKTLFSLLSEYGPVTTFDLNHRYRQFNRRGQDVGPGHDREILVHCRVRPC